MRSPVHEIRMVLSKNPCMHIHLILFFFQSKDRNKLISQFVKYLTTKGQQTLTLRFLRLNIFINLFFLWKYKNRMHTGSKWMIKYHLHQKYLQRFT